MKAKSPKEAKALGLRKYLTGNPCKNGNLAERYINGNCMCKICEDERCARQLRKPRQKEFKTRNKKGFAIQQAVLNKQWKQNNKAAVNAINMRRRADKLKATPKWFGEFDEFVIKEAHDLVVRRNKSTNIKWNVDHMIPIKAKEACGLHCASNIQVIPQKINLGKRQKMIFTKPFEWL